MLGEFGGLNGRELKAWNGFDLLEKGEPDSLGISEGNRGGFGVGRLWDLRFSPGCSGLSPLLSSCFPLFSSWLLRFWVFFCRSGCGELMLRGRWQEHGHGAAHAGLVRQRRANAGLAVAGAATLLWQDCCSRREAGTVRREREEDEGCSRGPGRGFEKKERKERKKKKRKWADGPSKEKKENENEKEERKRGKRKEIKLEKNKLKISKNTRKVVL